MSAYRVIDKMEIVVREGVWLPFGWRAVHGEQVLDLIEKLRSTLPEAARPRKPVEGSDRDFLDTVGTADARLTAPHDSATQEREIVSRAQSRADTIIAEAQNAARDIRRGADEYADQVLASL